MPVTAPVKVSSAMPDGVERGVGAGVAGAAVGLGSAVGDGDGVGVGEHDGFADGEGDGESDGSGRGVRCPFASGLSRGESLALGLGDTAAHDGEGDGDVVLFGPWTCALAGFPPSPRCAREIPSTSASTAKTTSPTRS
ncbi:MAG TPA: hypothetical protein VMU20_04590 [Candidatus Dormibacteraeota bacterium]|nr:hypothetical protein [Candidatus Dormibacteraeota bacterium]